MRSLLVFITLYRVMENEMINILDSNQACVFKLNKHEDDSVIYSWNF